MTTNVNSNELFHTKLKKLKDISIRELLTWIQTKILPLSMEDSMQLFACAHLTLLLQIMVSNLFTLWQGFFTHRYNLYVPQPFIFILESSGSPKLFFRARKNNHVRTTDVNWKGYLRQEMWIRSNYSRLSWRNSMPFPSENCWHGFEPTFSHFQWRIRCRCSLVQISP